MGTFDVKVGKTSVTLIDDDRIVIGIKTKKAFEPYTLERWAEVCSQGGDVIDVGAYSGLFSIAAAKLGAKPIAIEPLPALLNRIEENKKLNGVDFEVIAAAAGPKNGTETITFNGGVHLTSGASILKKSGASKIVRMLKLDSLKNIDNLSAIKIDVERYEVPVLEGALKIIEKHKPILFVEVLDSPLRDAVEKLLPRYRTIGLFDNRNIILEPR